MTVPDDKDKKANVIHTRVPDDLDAEIKRRAQSLGVSVSNLGIVTDSNLHANNSNGVSPAQQKFRFPQFVMICSAR